MYIIWKSIRLNQNLFDGNYNMCIQLISKHILQILLQNRYKIIKCISDIGFVS